MHYPNQIGSLFLSHGYRALLGMENISFVHNTAVITSRFAGDLTKWSFPESKRSVQNNLFIYCQGYPESSSPAPIDGCVELNSNLHWAPGHEQEHDWLNRATECPPSHQNAHQWGGSLWETNSIVGDPLFRCFELHSEELADFRLHRDSPARNCATPLAETMQLIPGVTGPHLGALQTDEPLCVGIDGRITAGDPGSRP